MTITIQDDFDLEKIKESGQCFRCRQSDNTYRFITSDKVLYIEPKGDCRYEISCSPKDWEKTWIPYFDLERDYSKIRACAAADPFMEKAIACGTGIRILRQDPWETLISFIISQRKNIPAIQKSVELLADRFGETTDTKRERVSLFPTADALASAGVDALSDCSLGYRTSYVYDTAVRISADPSLLNNWKNLDDPALFAELKTISGVGDKVASCVMLFAYGRTSFAPVDTWIGRVIAQEYGGVNPFPRYGENAGIMQQYVFYYMQKNK